MKTIVVSIKKYTEFVSGGMEYKLLATMKVSGGRVVDYQVHKVWAKGMTKYVRIKPFDMDLWLDCHDIEITKALQEEI